MFFGVISSLSTLTLLICVFSVFLWIRQTRGLSVTISSKNSLLVLLIFCIVFEASIFGFINIQYSLFFCFIDFLLYFYSVHLPTYLSLSCLSFLSFRFQVMPLILHLLILSYRHLRFSFIMALVAAHTFLYVVFSLSFCLQYFLIFLVIFFPRGLFTSILLLSKSLGLSSYQ